MEPIVKTHYEIKTQADAVIHFLQNLDIDMIDAVLEEGRTYQNLEKPIFIKKLGIALDEFLSSGDTFLNRHSGFCNAEICNYKCTGFRFIGNISKNYLDLVITIKDGVIQDMYECSIFKCHEGGEIVNENIEIDRLILPF